MKIGIFTVLFANLSFEEMLNKVASSGLETLEIGTGGFPGNVHCPLQELLENQQRRQEWLDTIRQHGLEISAFSCHANPLHPHPESAKEARQLIQETIQLAALIGVETINTFSGCPGESPYSQHPSWVTCPWPPEFNEVLKWQWEEIAIPYWQEVNTFSKNYGVRVAIEPHPGFLVYNTETALRLRERCGEWIGVNFDPSHFFWQGIDPSTSLKILAEAGALFHMHAKDTAFDEDNVRRNGVLDTKPYEQELARSWIFRTIGYGQSEETWKSIFSTLQKVGYTGTVSIEHEDSLMSVEEGFQKAVEFLKRLRIRERQHQLWWV